MQRQKKTADLLKQIDSALDTVLSILSKLALVSTSTGGDSPRESLCIQFTTLKGVCQWARKNLC